MRKGASPRTGSASCAFEAAAAADGTAAKPDDRQLLPALLVLLHETLLQTLLLAELPVLETLRNAVRLRGSRSLSPTAGTETVSRPLVRLFTAVLG